MHVLVTGLSHQTASVELRERLSFDENQYKMPLTHLRDMKSIQECVIVSTCNRMEIYVVCDQLHTGTYYTQSFLESWFRIPKEEFSDHLYRKSGEEAVEHLFRVVCGLESMVVGETQILGQIKNAFRVALDTGTTGTILNRLFQQAFTLGKRAHSETEIGQNAVSVSYAAMELGKKMFDSFQEKTVLLIGAGKMSELTAKYFYASGAQRVLVLNRTKERAERIAKRFQGEARTLDALVPSLQEADIVVSSTGSDQFIVTKDMVERSRQNRTSPLFLIDIAVPRDIDPEVHEIEQVYLYNIDDLHGIVAMNKSLREQEAQRVQDWIDQERAQFSEWVETLGVVPLITALREKALQVQSEAMKRIERKLPDLSEQERRVIRKQTKGIINQLISSPIVRLKEMAVSKQKEEAKKMFVTLFALERMIGEVDDSEVETLLMDGKISSLGWE